MMVCGGVSRGSLVLVATSGRRARQVLCSRNPKVGRPRGISAATPAAAPVASSPQISAARACPESSIKMVSPMVAALPP